MFIEKDLLGRIYEKEYKGSIVNIEILNQLSIHDVLKLETSNGVYILKIYDKSENHISESSMLVQNYLYGTSSFVPKVIQNYSGRYVSPLNDNKIFTVQEYICPSDKSHPDILLDLVRATKMLHENMSTLRLKTGNVTRIMHSDSLDAIAAICPGSILNKSCARLLDERKILLEKYKLNYSPSVLANIHGDLKRSNVLIKGKALYYIDFDYACFGDLLFEIGYLALHFSNMDKSAFVKFLRIFQSNYEHISFTSLQVIENLIAYYINSSFPLKRIHKLRDEVCDSICLDRLKSLIFLTSIYDELL